MERIYKDTYVLGRTIGFLQFNVVCLDVRERAGAQKMVHRDYACSCL